MIVEVKDFKRVQFSDASKLITDLQRTQNRIMFHKKQAGKRS